MNTDVIFEINSGTEIGQSARCAFFGVIDTSFAVWITKKASEAGGVGISTVETSIRALGGSQDEEMIDIAGILFASGTRAVACSKAQVTS